MYKILDNSLRDMLYFDFLGKGLGIVFSPYFAYDFSRKMFLIFNGLTFAKNCLKLENATLRKII